MNGFIHVRCCTLYCQVVKCSCVANRSAVALSSCALLSCSLCLVIIKVLCVPVVKWSFVVKGLHFEPLVINQVMTLIVVSVKD